MILRSIRWRLQVWHGLMLVVVLAGLGATAYQLERATRFQAVDQELDGRLSDLHRSLRDGPRNHRPPQRDGWDEPPPGRRGDFPPPPRDFRLDPAVAGLFATNGVSPYYFVVWSRAGHEVARSDSAPAFVPKISGLQTNQVPLQRTRGDVREALIMTPPGEVLLSGRSIAGELAGLNRFAAWLFSAGCVVLVVGLVGGWFLASRVIRPIEVISAAAVRIAAGNLSERIRIGETESELGKLGNVLNDTFARLDASFEQQRQFTADASHELRTPLTVLLSQTQMALGRDRSAGEYREALETCQRAAQRMRRLIESLLDLSRLDAGREPLRVESFDLSELARESLDLLGSLLQERNLTLKSELSAVRCCGDPQRMAQVVTNLVSNAIHYNRQGGEVCVAVRADGPDAVLEVTDTGIGIEEEDLPHVFRRFFRADRARTAAEGRSGLGLAIAGSIIHAHRGGITVSSTVGVGSRFTVRLPAGAFPVNSTHPPDDRVPPCG